MSAKTALIPASSWSSPVAFVLPLAPPSLPIPPYGLTDYPGSYHNGAGNLSFADGHADPHKWLDPRTRPPLVKDTMISPRKFTDGIPSPGNPDVRWLQERTFQK